MLALVGCRRFRFLQKAHNIYSDLFRSAFPGRISLIKGGCSKKKERGNIIKCLNFGKGISNNSFFRNLVLSLPLELGYGVDDKSSFRSKTIFDSQQVVGPKTLSLCKMEFFLIFHNS